MSDSLPTNLSTGRDPGTTPEASDRLRPLAPLTVVALLVAAAALVIVVGLASHANVQAGSSSPSQGGLGLVFDGIVALVVFVCFIGGFIMFWSLLPHRIHGKAPTQEVINKRPKKPWKERILATLISAVLVGGVFTALELTHSLHYTHRKLPSLLGGNINAARQLQQKARGQNEQSVNWGLAGLTGGGIAAVIILGGGTLFLIRRSREQTMMGPVDTPAATSLEAVEIGIWELQAEPDPRRAVIRAYGGMERSLSRRGVRRRPSETPFEYLERILVEGGVPRPAATHLTDLFERARFSHHAIGGELKEEALQALIDIRESLEAPEPRVEPVPAGASA